MKVEIAILCIDDGRVPRHKIITWEIKGNESRDRRMQSLHNSIAKMLKAEFPNPAKLTAAQAAKRVALKGST